MEQNCRVRHLLTAAFAYLHDPGAATVGVRAASAVPAMVSASLLVLVLLLLLRLVSTDLLWAPRSAVDVIVESDC